MSLTPLDDQEFTRKLFTPMTLDGIIYLAKTTWPISTVFRLYLENLNWVSNAQTASGPTPKEPPDVDDFLRGIEAMQVLRDRNQIVFGIEERTEVLGGPLPAASVGARDLVEAAKSGWEYRQDEKTGTWTLIKKNSQPVLFVNSSAAPSPEMEEFTRTFGSRRASPNTTSRRRRCGHFPRRFRRGRDESRPRNALRSLQALYYVSHGIDVPPSMWRGAS